MCQQLKKIIIFVGILICSLQLTSQTIGSFVGLTDSIAAFEKQKNFTKIIAIGKLAIHRDIDFYKLRMSLGNAYLNKGNFQQAYLHFNKAYQFDPSSIEALQNLNTCAVLNGQNNLSNYYKPKLGITNQVLQKVYAETGSKLSSRTDSINHLYYVHLGLLLNISKQLETYQGYFYCTQKSSLYDVTQHQYLGIATIVLNPTLQLKLGFSYLQALVNEHFQNSQQTIANFTEAITINKQIANLNIGLNAAICRLNKQEQWQIGALFQYAPLGNDKLNIQFNPILQNQNTEYKVIYNPSVSIKLWKNSWLIGTYTYANTTNYIEQEGFMVHNNYDTTNDKFALMFNYKTQSNKDFYLCYQLESKTRKYLEPLYYSEVNQVYTFNNLIIGYTLKN